MQDIRLLLQTVLPETNQLLFALFIKVLGMLLLKLKFFMSVSSGSRSKVRPTLSGSIHSTLW